MPRIGHRSRHRKRRKRRLSRQRKSRLRQRYRLDRTLARRRAPFLRTKINRIDFAKRPRIDFAKRPRIDFAKRPRIGFAKRLRVPHSRLVRHAHRRLLPLFRSHLTRLRSRWQSPRPFSRVHHRRNPTTQKVSRPPRLQKSRLRQPIHIASTSTRSHP